MSKTESREPDRSFRDRSDEEKISALTEKYGADTEVGRLAREVLDRLDTGDREDGSDD